MKLFSLIPIILILGSAPDCEGFGFCQVQRESTEVLADCESNTHCVAAQLDYIDGELILVVSQNKISDKAFIKFFTKENFELEKDYALPYPIRTELGFLDQVIIKAGKYPILEEHGKIVVRFKV